ncbi:Cinorf13 protein [Actinokineospora spheciospongiae]|uniref:Cinorf13 protein n=1 Tax=Actinokineospora spheciospongiae TaxID=909613 RepID=W7J0C5_9PSEU|nr:hypothetical protein [Actinokineospora spheciospongiae]EWC62361.1 Cinorf13 protein [Actinokineospora spheciospongiae]
MTPTAPTSRARVTRFLRDCQARLSALDLPEVDSIAALIEALSRRTGRPIQLVPMALAASPCSGLWLAVAGTDLIVYEAGTTVPHQEHIIAHELAHIVCGHRSTGPVDDETSRLLFPDLDPLLVRDMLARAEYSDDHELEAEVMASLILLRIRSFSARRGPAGSGPAAVLARLERSFAPAGGGV